MKIGFDFRPALWGKAGIARYVRELTREPRVVDNLPMLEFATGALPISWAPLRARLKRLTHYCFSSQRNDGHS